MTHPMLAVFPETALRELAKVEERLVAQAEARDANLASWSRKAIASGGKRIRPLLVLTAFDACAPLGGKSVERSTVIDAAVALELVHTASLVHDDIMDEADERRGAPSIYKAHGRDAAILVGDYLFTQAFAIAARLPKAVMDVTADACRRLCEGQLREQALQESGRADRDAYVAVIRDKTASLLAAACASGAILAGAPQTTVDGLHHYGNAIGHAFQVLDDVLDVAGDPQWTGKPAGTDYVEGTLSSPYLHYLERGGRLDAQRTSGEFPQVRARLMESGAVAASQLEAGAYTQSALLDLQALPASPSREALELLAELLMERAA